MTKSNMVTVRNSSTNHQIYGSDGFDAEFILTSDMMNNSIDTTCDFHAFDNSEQNMIMGHCSSVTETMFNQDKSGLGYNQVMSRGFMVNNTDNIDTANDMPIFSFNAQESGRSYIEILDYNIPQTSGAFTILKFNAVHSSDDYYSDTISHMDDDSGMFSFMFRTSYDKYTTINHDGEWLYADHTYMSDKNIDLLRYHFQNASDGYTDVVAYYTDGYNHTHELFSTTLDQEMGETNIVVSTMMYGDDTQYDAHHGSYDPHHGSCDPSISISLNL